MSTKKYHGSCHCGKIKFEAAIDLSKGTNKCNCRYCTKIRAWSVIVKPGNFTVTSGDNDRVVYKERVNESSRVSITFCGTCGIKTFERGNAPWFGGEYVSIYLSSLDDASVDELLSGPINHMDGRHDNWMSPPADTRAM